MAYVCECIIYVSHTFPQRCFVSQAWDRGCQETSGRPPTWNHLALFPLPAKRENTEGRVERCRRGETEREKRPNWGYSAEWDTCKCWIKHATVSVKLILATTTDPKHIKLLLCCWSSSETSRAKCCYFLSSVIDLLFFVRVTDLKPLWDCGEVDTATEWHMSCRDSLILSAAICLQLHTHTQLTATVSLQKQNTYLH